MGKWMVITCSARVLITAKFLNPSSPGKIYNIIIIHFVNMG
jgi:hypothetical protein